jgi:heme exporter protein C
MRSQPTALKVLNVLSVALFLAALGMVFLYAPLEESMNFVQKIFYFHIANAWVGMLGFLAAAVAGVAYLRTDDLKWDIVEMAAVEISLIFFFIAIATGSIWARPAWGKWWTWEPRLTTAAILEMIYIAYYILRQGIEDPDRRARFGAIYTLVGSLSVPITFMSIRVAPQIFQSHPVVIGAASGAVRSGFNMTPPMLLTMFFSLITFSVIFAALFWHRIRIGQLTSQVEELKHRVTE